ncbi:MAG TPA: DinB family protein [Pyrinomonadaceae bacterium]|jgi:hypothetical protein|nr:DinB family protein [Pyrinomonadaceae bacterium]
MNFGEILNALQETPDLLLAAIDGLTEQNLRVKPKPDEFSVLENICHLRDLEVEAYTIRIDRILNEENPALLDFDGGKIASERDYHNEDVSVALSAFKAARSYNVTRLSGLDSSQLNRNAVLEGVGKITLSDLATMMLEHDTGHLQDLSIENTKLRTSYSTASTSTIRSR